MASPFNGRWSLVASEGLATYFDSINTPEEHKEKIRQLGEAVKKDHNVYVEELKVDVTTFHRQAFVHGEKKKDSGDVAFDTEHDAKLGDGRPAKIRVTLESPTKIKRTEKGDGFNTTSTFEVSGDDLTVTLSSGTATAVEKFKRVG
jgi:hypothetical protein